MTGNLGSMQGKGNIAVNSCIGGKARWGKGGGGVRAFVSTQASIERGYRRDTHEDENSTCKG